MTCLLPSIQSLCFLAVHLLSFSFVLGVLLSLTQQSCLVWLPSLFFPSACNRSLLVLTVVLQTATAALKMPKAALKAALRMVGGLQMDKVVLQRHTAVLRMPRAVLQKPTPVLQRLKAVLQMPKKVLHGSTSTAPLHSSVRVLLLATLHSLSTLLLLPHPVPRQPTLQLPTLQSPAPWLLTTLPAPRSVTTPPPQSYTPTTLRPRAQTPQHCQRQ